MRKMCHGTGETAETFPLRIEGLNYFSQFNDLHISTCDDGAILWRLDGNDVGL
jgi:hypothetical protein